MMNELLRIRGLIDSSKGAGDMSNWKLLKSGTIEEETNSINIDLDGEYEELEILIFNCGTASNDSVNNTNGHIDCTSSGNVTAGGFVRLFALKKGVQRLVRLKCGINPYFNCTYQVLSDANFNKCVNTSLAAQGYFFDRNFNDKIKKVKIDVQVGFLGVGTEYVIYGK